MKLIKISLIIFGSVSLIYLGGCKNPLKKFKQHDSDKTNLTPAPNNETTDKNKVKHIKGKPNSENKVAKLSNI